MPEYTQTVWTHHLARKAGGFVELGHLRDDCADAGLLGIDALTAIDAYFEHGPVTADDLVRISQLGGAERDVFMADRWGVSGSRVAAMIARRRAA